MALSYSVRLFFGNLTKQNNLLSNLRNFSIFPSLRLKEITEVRQDKQVVISAKYVPSPRESLVVENAHPSTCALCSSGLDLKHTDVLILSQFLRSDGCLLPKRITGLCRKQQRRISALVGMAQKAGLMSNINPPNSKKDPKRRSGWKKYNKYFDESTIKVQGIKF